MKKTLLLLLIAGTLAGCGAKPEATVEGSVTGAPDSTTIYLGRYDGDIIKLDSTLLHNGAFRFDILKAYPERLFIFTEAPRGTFPFIVEAGTIRAEINYDTRRSDFSGTLNNDLLKEYNDHVAALQVRRSAIMDQFRANPDMDAATQDSLGGLMNAIGDEWTALEIDFIHRHNNSIAAAYLLSQQSTYGYTPEKMDSVLAILGSELPANRFIDDMKERREVLVKTAVGQPAPDFTLPQADGTPFTLSSLKGQVVLIDFWASWCGPCRNENPHVVKMYNNYKDHGFTIVGVSLDENREKWLEAVEADGLTWTQVSESTGWNTPPAKAYGVVAIPHTVLIDRDGIIVGNVVRGKKLEELVAKTLGVEIVQD